jgi:hypothetical protein
MSISTFGPSSLGSICNKSTTRLLRQAIISKTKSIYPGSSRAGCTKRRSVQVYIFEYINLRSDGRVFASPLANFGRGNALIYEISHCGVLRVSRCPRGLSKSVPRQPFRLLFPKCILLRLFGKQPWSQRQQQQPALLESFLQLLRSRNLPRASHAAITDSNARISRVIPACARTHKFPISEILKHRTRY